MCNIFSDQTFRYVCLFKVMIVISLAMDKIVGEHRMMDPVILYYGKGQLSGFLADPDGVLDVVIISC